MIEGRLSRRYTRALFQLAREAGEEEKIGDEIERFFALYSGSDLRKVLINPAFAMGPRKKILVQTIHSQQLSHLTVKFLSLLLERDRLVELAGIVSCYRRLLNEAKGRVEARVVSTGALDAAMVEQVRQRLRGLAGKEVILQQETDPSLLGGLLIELEGKIYDGSIRTQLEKMKQRIARGQ
ncbi:MAG TPA: ATP synthase F1 subunit delta [Candidatus Binatia bacterium]|nr:ATP synthase F1 subunit delta [Candidatus Binatia bacterium]